MSTQLTPPQITAAKGSEPATSGTLLRRRRRRSSSPAGSLLAHGEPLVWLIGGALVLAMAMIVGLLGLIMTLGLDTFRPRPLVELRLRDGRVLLGEVARSESAHVTADLVLGASPEDRQRLIDRLLAAAGGSQQLVAALERRTKLLERDASEIRQRGPNPTRTSSIRATISRDASFEASVGPFARRDQILAHPASDRSLENRRQRTSLKERAASLEREIAELQRAAQYFSSRSEVAAESLLAADESVQRAAVEGLMELAKRAEPDSLRYRRRMIRTGNYELTNEHFQWVADYQIDAQGESQPLDATLVERLTWGRFYGRPAALRITHTRPVSQAERDLTVIAGLIESHRSALRDADRRPLIDATLREVDAALAEERARTTKQCLQPLTGLQAIQPRIMLQAASGQEQPLGDELAGDAPVAAATAYVDDPAAAWAEFQRVHGQTVGWRKERARLEKETLGAQFARQEAARIELRSAELDHDVGLTPLAEQLRALDEQQLALRARRSDGERLVGFVHGHFGPKSQTTALVVPLARAQRAEAEHQQAGLMAEQKRLEAELDRLPAHARRAVREYVTVERTAAAASEEIRQRIDELRALDERFQLEMVTADGQSTTLAASEIVRAFQPNRLSTAGRLGVYLSRWWEFISQEPREANSEGGVMPAIWGTVVMTLIMSLAVVPFGVMAALYLREYAKSGPTTSLIRIAINNLAGVPSIVFGVFGLGFFCYVIGAYLDGGPHNAGILPLPPLRWYLTLALLAVVATGAFLLGLATLRNGGAAPRRWHRLFAYGSLAGWLVATFLLVVVLFKTPFFSGFYEANLPNPHWGKGGVIWASLTLALLTLPVVIVATEEALAAVPNSMREGSFGCGASRWQTIQRIVLPHALPGIMTGMILAMARGAGEVAPLMLVGAVKLAPELPIDLTSPYLHGSRSFMHLGFHVFDVGFQSQNSEAAKPMVYTTALLLIVIITVLNLLAVRLRAYLRRRFVSGHF